MEKRGPRPVGNLGLLQSCMRDCRRPGAVALWPDVAPGDVSPTTPTPEALLAYFQPLFTFVDVELSAGRHVLIHCLAGAHRAGSAGVACLMHMEGLDCASATRKAQQGRKIIDPIHHLYYLLTQLDAALGTRVESTATIREPEYAHRFETARHTPSARTVNTVWSKE